MMIKRGNQFIKTDFRFIDLGFKAVIDRRTWSVYEVLLRFVWRDEDKGHREMRALYKEGYLCARISQQKLGLYAGIERRMTHTHLVQLKNLGWIQPVTFVDKNVGSLCYVLGEAVTDEDGKRHEFYKRELHLEACWEKFVEAAKAKDGPKADPRESFTVSERIDMLREMLKQ